VENGVIGHTNLPMKAENQEEEEEEEDKSAVLGCLKTKAMSLYVNRSHLHNSIEHWSCKVIANRLVITLH